MVRGFPLLLTALVLCTVSPVAMAGPEAGAAPALPGIAGTVVGPDGAPVVGAQVCIVGEETYLELIDGRLTPVRNGSEVPINITDEHGRYAFAKTPDLYLVVAVAREVGYGEVLASKEQPATDVKLSPWGRIEGLVMMGDKPAVGMKLDLDQARWDLGHFGERNKATTDAEGCFVIDHAMPGTVSVCRPVVRFSRYDSGFASLMAWLDPITVQAGTTTRCTLDAQVLRVRGRVVLPEGLAAGDANVLAILWNLDAPPMPTRPEELLMPDAAALRAWRLSDAGRQYYRELAAEAAVLRNFVADALPDMTLQARGMPPGRYALTVLASRPGDQKTLAMTGTSIEVTVSAAKPLIDLGDLQLEVVRDAAVGQTVRDMVCKALAGEGKVQLTDYRGRYLLLAAWANDCRPCLRSMPKLAELYARLEKDPRAALLGLYVSYDPPERALKYLADHGYRWPQAMPGIEQYNVRFGTSQGLPSYIVIDPAGVVLSRGSDLTEAIRVLDAALAR